MKTSEVLFKAADRIERTGLHKGGFAGPGGNDNCAVCVLGAINWAGTSDPHNPMVSYPVSTALHAHLIRSGVVARYTWQPITGWSDGSTEVEVVTEMRAAARYEQGWGR